MAASSSGRPPGDINPAPFMLADGTNKKKFRPFLQYLTDVWSGDHVSDQFGFNWSQLHGLQMMSHLERLGVVAAIFPCVCKVFP